MASKPEAKKNTSKTTTTYAKNEPPLHKTPTRKKVRAKPLERKPRKNPGAAGDNTEPKKAKTLATFKTEFELSGVFNLSGESPAAFAADLVKVRKDLKLTPSIVARRMGIDLGNYSRIEKGKGGFPRQATIRDLAFALRGEIIITYPPELDRPEY